MTSVQLGDSPEGAITMRLLSGQVESRRDHSVQVVPLIAVVMTLAFALAACVSGAPATKTADSALTTVLTTSTTARASTTTAATSTTLAPTSTTTTFPATTTAPRPSTTRVPTTSAPVPPTTILSPAPIGATALHLPVSVAGYSTDGVVHRETVRVFDDGLMRLPSTFNSSGDQCNQAIWTLRWSSRNPDVAVLATYGDPFLADQAPLEGYEIVATPPESTAGYISGGICFAPVFVFASALNGNGSNLVDVDLEWQYWDATSIEAVADRSGLTTG